MMLTVGDLKKVIEDNNLPDDVEIYFEHIEDKYIDGFCLKNGQFSEGWKTIDLKGFKYGRAVWWNNNIEKGKLVLSGELSPDECGYYFYGEEYKDEMIPEDLNNLDLYDRYVSGSCCFYSKEHNVLFINGHY